MRIDELLWEQAESSGSCTDYHKFLRRPESEFKAKAISRMKSLLLNATQSIRTLRLIVYEEFKLSVEDRAKSILASVI